MPSVQPMPGRCGAKSANGFCTQRPISGTKRCRMHAGKSLVKAKAEGQVVVELRNWGLTDTTVDPGETLLKLVTQSAARVEFYAGLLQQAYAAAERLREAESLPDGGGAQATARLDMERVLNTGGVAVLIGHTYAGTQTSGVIATGEAIRGLAKLEAEERDRCANFATKAVAAGLAERQVRLAERQGELLAQALQMVLSAPEFGATDAQRQVLPALLTRAVAELGGAA